MTNTTTDWLSSRRLVSDTWSRDLERLQVRARKAKESMKKERLEKVLPKTTFEEADKGRLKVVDLKSKDFLRELENAIQFGFAYLLQVSELCDVYSHISAAQ